MSKSPFPHLIDNTMRSTFLKCPRSMHWAHVEHWGPASPSIHLHAGGAFANGLEKARRAFFEQGLSESESLRQGLEGIIKFYGPIQAPETKSGDKSLENVIKAFDSYFQQYPLGSDPIVPFKTVSGRTMIEFTFSIPTEVNHPETGDPILYGGRSDMIGVLNGALFVTDEKTASALGQQWANNWIMESQFTGYIKAAMDYGYPVAGALIRGVGLLKTKITHQEAIVYRSRWEIDRWWEQLQRDIKRMIQCWKEDYWDYALSKDSCNAYGGCPFLMLCSSAQPEQWLPIHYRQKIWNPLEKDMGEHLLDNQVWLKELTSPELDIPELLQIQGGKK